MLETTEVISSDLQADASVYLEDVNERGIIVLVARHHGHHGPHQISRYFYPCSVVGWIRLIEEDERS